MTVKAFYTIVNDLELLEGLEQLEECRMEERFKHIDAGEDDDTDSRRIEQGTDTPE